MGEKMKHYPFGLGEPQLVLITTDSEGEKKVEPVGYVESKNIKREIASTHESEEKQ